MLRISQETIDLLNNQLNEEHYSANLYFNMAGWCSQKGLKGAARFLYNHSGEEHAHLDKISEFIQKVGGQPVMKAMQAPTTEFKDIKEIFELIVKHEQHITDCVFKLVESSDKNKDYATARFLDWFVNEQVEEEELFNDIMDKINILGELKGRSLYSFDKFLAALDASRTGK